MLVPSCASMWRRLECRAPGHGKATREKLRAAGITVDDDEDVRLDQVRSAECPSQNHSPSAATQLENHESCDQGVQVIFKCGRASCSRRRRYDA